MKSTYIFIIAFLVLSLTACTEKLDTNYEGKSDNFLVIVGEISTDTTEHVVKLSRTVNYNDTLSPAETGAVVTIQDGSQVFPLKETAPGVYKTSPDVYGLEGHEYILTVTTRDGKIYTSKSTIERITVMDSVTIRFEHFSFTNQDFYKIYFNGQEPPGKGDCYIWNLYLDGAKFNDTLKKSQIQSDEMVDGQYVSNFDIYWLEPDQLPSDTTLITVEIVSVPENYYQYLIEVLSETAWRGTPFDATPANVTTNIEGEGVVGFFAATQKKRMSQLYIKQQEME